MPAIKFHWRAGYFRHSSGGSRFTASPRISIARSNARTVCHAESKLDKVLSLQIACACLAKSAICLSVTSGLRLLINWQSLARSSSSMYLFNREQRSTFPPRMWLSSSCQPKYAKPTSEADPKSTSTSISLRCGSKSSRNTDPNRLNLRICLARQNSAIFLESILIGSSAMLTLLMSLKADCRATFSISVRNRRHKDSVRLSSPYRQP